MAMDLDTSEFIVFSSVACLAGTYLYVCGATVRRLKIIQPLSVRRVPHCYALCCLQLPSLFARWMSAKVPQSPLCLLKWECSRASARPPLPELLTPSQCASCRSASTLPQDRCAACRAGGRCLILAQAVIASGKALWDRELLQADTLLLGGTCTELGLF